MNFKTPPGSTDSADCSSPARGLRPGPRDLVEAFAEEPELILACLQSGGPGSPSAVGSILEAAERSLGRHPQYADLHYFAARAAIDADKLEAAARLVGQALEINPEYRDALILAARVALRRGDWEEARAQLERALAFGADYPDVHTLLGEAHARAGALESARAAYERALELNPHLVEAREALATLQSSRRVGGS